VGDDGRPWYESYRHLGRDGEVDGPWDVYPSLLGIVAYGLLGWVVYRLAARRFERVGQG
jgi:hypothetical protein